MQLLDVESHPTAILPAQLSDRPLGGVRLQPEKRLQLAVLVDAVLTFERYAGDPHARARRLFMETNGWFASSDTDGPFAFLVICESLQLDPSYIRRGLHQWSAQRQATAKRTRPLRRDSIGNRHQVVLARLRRVG